MVTTFAERPEAATNATDYEYDFFISHASEDKERFVRPLADALAARGARVWYDEFTLRVGDSIHAAISKGLRTSRAGIVVLSQDFFAKSWPQHELDGLMTLANRRPDRSILPIWHGVSAARVSGFSPGLAGIFALSTRELSPDQIADNLIAVSRQAEPERIGRQMDIAKFDLSELEHVAFKSFSRWQQLLSETAIASPARLFNGFHEMTMTLLPKPEPIPLKAALARILEAGDVELSDLPPFADMTVPEWSPTPVGNCIEAWPGKPLDKGTVVVQNTPDMSDFWRAYDDGMLYTIRGFSEDRDADTAGERFDIRLPIVRVADTLLFARRYANLFDAIESIGIRIRFAGLTGRRLTTSTFEYFIREERVCRTDEVICAAIVSCDEIDNGLPEAIRPMLSNLYEQFGFFELEMPLVQNEVSRLLAGRASFN